MDSFVTDIDGMPVRIYAVENGGRWPVDISSFYGVLPADPDHVYTVHRRDYNNARFSPNDYLGRIIHGRVIRCIWNRWQTVYINDVGLYFWELAYADKVVLYQLHERYSLRIGLLIAWRRANIEKSIEDKINVCRDIAKHFDCAAAKDAARYLFWGNKQLRESVVTAIGLV